MLVFGPDWQISLFPEIYYNKPMKMLAFLLLLSVHASALNIKAPAARADVPAQIRPSTESTPGYCIFGAQSGKPFSSEAAFRSIVWKSDIIYVGETPGQIKTHLAQLETLQALRIARGSRIAVGFEMLDSAVQPVLDKYAAGELTEEEFLTGSDWTGQWGFDFGLYKPLFDFVIRNKLRALALNVPKTVVSKIARSGLEGLTPEERRLLPEKINITGHKKYLEYLKESFAGSEGSPAPQAFTWENYLASVSAWNEGMGARIADFVNTNPGWALLIITGNAHVAYNAAIPASVKSRTTNIRQASFYTENSATCPAVFPKGHKNLANYIWYIGRSSAPVNSNP